MQVSKRAAVLVVALSAVPALAQSFNIDYGNGAGGFGAPAAAHGAAAMQPGCWNNVPNIALFPLVDLACNMTPAAIQVSGGANAVFNSCKAANEQRLMDDFLGLGGAARVVTISGLTPGAIYDVYTYAWSPNNAAHVTQVTINGVAQNVGGMCFAGYALGVTHALHSGVVVPAGGMIQINLAPIVGPGRLNGIQLKQVGGPGAGGGGGDGNPNPN